MSDVLKKSHLLVVGAGVMGIGIAQVAAQSGHSVLLYDNRENAASEAIKKLRNTFDKLVSRGKLTEQDAGSAMALIRPVVNLSEVASCQLVVEAVVESLEIKRSIFHNLEDIVSTKCILATNTSSLSITAIANGLKHPERLVGMHFFNPVPLMKLVEVVSGLQTSAEIAEQVYRLATDWGKYPVYARSSPGFIVNRIARPFYAEALELLQQRSTEPAVLDACFRDAGFKMGPCELMDLIGHDVNFAVTKSIYQANYSDKRYKPSIIQQELVEGGLWGRKSGQGFYQYPGESVENSPMDNSSPNEVSENTVILHGDNFVARMLEDRLENMKISYSVCTDSDWTGLDIDGRQLRLTDGACASKMGRDRVVFDLPLNHNSGDALAVAFSNRISDEWREESLNWLRWFGFEPQAVADLPGLVVARTIAMIINEAADAVQQGVCSEEAADNAMKLGVNYPQGPFEWLSRWDAGYVVKILEELADFYRGERYRVSPKLRHLVWKYVD